MKNRRNKGILLLALTLLIAALLTANVACEPPVPLQVENRTDMVLTIYVQGVEAGEVEPSNSMRVKNLGATGYYLIEAKNTKSEVVYSRKLSFTELNDMDWTIVIPPLQKEPESSDNVTGS